MILIEISFMNEFCVVKENFAVGILALFNFEGILNIVIITRLRKKRLVKKNVSCIGIFNSDSNQGKW